MLCWTDDGGDAADRGAEATVLRPAPARVAGRRVGRVPPPYGEWIRVLRASGFDVLDLVEVQAPEARSPAVRGASLAGLGARRWPSEEIGGRGRSRERFSRGSRSCWPPRRHSGGRSWRSLGSRSTSSRRGTRSGPAATRFRRRSARRGLWRMRLASDRCWAWTQSCGSGRARSASRRPPVRPRRCWMSWAGGRTRSCRGSRS